MSKSQSYLMIWIKCRYVCMCVKSRLSLAFEENCSCRYFCLHRLFRSWKLQLRTFQCCTQCTENRVNSCWLDMYNRFIVGKVAMYICRRTDKDNWLALICLSFVSDEHWRLIDVARKLDKTPTSRRFSLQQGTRCDTEDQSNVNFLEKFCPQIFWLCINDFHAFNV